MDKDLEYEAQKGLVRVAEKFARPSVLTEGTIFSIDEVNFTCVVLMTDGTKVNNVPLKVLIGLQPSIIEIPTIGTDCLLRFKDNNVQRPQLESAHEIDKLLWKIGDQIFQFDANGFNFNNSNAGMVLLSACLAAINRLETILKTHVHTAISLGAITSTPQDATETPITFVNTTRKDLENTKILQETI